MAQALGVFDEPHAWLIRGLIEYGWADLTPQGGRIPPGRFGGLELARFRDTGGRDGVHLLIHAAAGGQVVAEDGVYDFSARCTHRDGHWTVVVRCVEANFLQEFPFDPSQPSWVAGYIHQAVTTYVPQFVQWRLSGGELSWAQRKGLPEVPGEPCSVDLNRFLDEMVRMRRPLDAGPAENWWLGMATAPPPASVAAAHRPGAAPAPISGAAPIAMAGKAAAGGISTTERALSRSRPAGKALVGASVVLCLVGGVSLLNALLTLILFFFDRPGPLLGSAVFGLLFLAFGGVGILGGKRLSDLKESLLPWPAIAGNLALPPLLGLSVLLIDPICCALIGPLMLNVPIGLWALATMVNPEVIRARADLAGR